MNEKTTRKICFITGTRAEYGLLKGVMKKVQATENLDLQVLVTGMHLSTEFGLTYREIIPDEIPINAKVEMLLSSDTPTGLAKSMGIGLIGISDALHRLNPDLIVVLGDRYEIFSAVCAAMLARIPVAHISGGEVTQGAFDEAIRHSLTKMSQLHFVSTQEYYNRVVQLGEEPNRVFLVGALSADNIKNSHFYTKTELEESLDFKLGEKNLLITFHPVTLEKSTSAEQMNELLNALRKLGNKTHLFFTMPNADTDSRILFDMINQFVKDNDNARVYTSLGQARYLSCIHYMDAVVGNSSSGLTEAPILKKGTINIGDRQLGRIKPESVIDCDPEEQSIIQAIQTLYSNEFNEMLIRLDHPFGDGDTGKRIVEVIKRFPLDNILKKTFYDLPIEN